MNKELQKVLDNQRGLVDAFIAEANKIGLVEPFLSRAVNSIFYRGFTKNIDVHVRRLKIIQDRDNYIINKDFIGDKLAGKATNGHFSYSGIGKTAGIETWAVLAKVATDDQIGEFYTLLKVDKLSMQKAKQTLHTRYGIDFSISV